MLGKFWNRVEQTERRVRRSFGKDITDPSARRWSKFHYQFFDHAFLRSFWTNFFQIAPGVYRSNQPTHARFEKYAAMGIKTVVNLRGEEKYSHYLFEKESTEALGMTLVNAKLWARMAASRARIVHVIDVLRAAEKPLMFHCKSGADRAGFVAALYLLVFEDAPVADARKQLGLKYIHLDFTKTGIQDYILDVYAARTARDPIGFEAWIRTEYDSKVIQHGFDSQIPADRLGLTT
ncbi:tyrosine-protein phosphatase [Puniceibacterium sp. IMCC21224]|uniref:phosphatase domain-containing protein n=1 Tax=Puniceibacterium sp. IMCC21224 TaxID=1618204 RepID=UPI00064DFDD8|nr:tyrosine-protein phosphatase [Puniceibacterium sp. IMCC21224]KMK66128.1 Tyrosine phosphatase family [Puniceibacterium sp. IMCC21224]